MGKLLLKETIDNIRWYCSDAYYIHDGRGYYQYKWPSPDWPFRHYIHSEKLTQKEMVRSRRWIENTITDTVIFDSIDWHYRRYYGDRTEWIPGMEVRNTWYRFSFEDKNTALMFKIAFTDLIQTPTNHHPDRPEDEEWLKTSNQHKQRHEL